MSGEDYHKARPVQPTLHPLICLSTVSTGRTGKNCKLWKMWVICLKIRKTWIFWVEPGGVVEQRMSEAADQQDLSPVFCIEIHWQAC